MRGTTDGLPNPRPLIDGLPRVLREDPYVSRLMEVFDGILAPIYSTVDNVPAYLDPSLTPEDFVSWLAGWVAASLDENWPVDRQRAVIAQSAGFHRRRGTAMGLAEHVRALTDCQVEIVENGAVAWSQVAAAALPGSADPFLIVRVIAADRAGVDLVKLDEIVAAAKPAHVPHSIEVVGADVAASTE